MSLKYIYDKLYRATPLKRYDVVIIEGDTIELKILDDNTNPAAGTRHRTYADGFRYGGRTIGGITTDTLEQVEFPGGYFDSKGIPHYRIPASRLSMVRHTQKQHHRCRRHPRPYRSHRNALRTKRR